MTISAKELIEAAIKVINRPGAWCKGALARDAGGESVNPDDPSACKWCALGSLQRVAHELEIHQFGPTLRAARRLLDQEVMRSDPKISDWAVRPAAEFNDHCGTTRRKVVAMMRRAAAAA